MPPEDETLQRLLAMVLEAPDEDAPRLTYADRCEDLGECARAELVRLQVELAKPYAPGPVPPGLSLAQHLCDQGDRRRAKQQRVDELISGHAAAWFSPPGFIAYPAAAWRRGFVDVIDATPTELVVHAAAVLAEQPVREFRARGVRQVVTVGQYAGSPLGARPAWVLRVTDVGNVRSWTEMTYAGRADLAADLPERLGLLLAAPGQLGRLAGAARGQVVELTREAIFHDTAETPLQRFHREHGAPVMIDPRVLAQADAGQNYAAAAAGQPARPPACPACGGPLSPWVGDRAGFRYRCLACEPTAGSLAGTPAPPRRRP